MSSDDHKNQYFVEIKSIIRLLKLYLKKKNQCLPGYEQASEPPDPLSNEFPFFLDIDLSTRSLRHLLVRNVISNPCVRHEPLTTVNRQLDYTESTALLMPNVKSTQDSLHRYPMCDQCRTIPIKILEIEEPKYGSIDIDIAKRTSNSHVFAYAKQIVFREFTIRGSNRLQLQVTALVIDFIIVVFDLIP